ncbi:HupE/UreJ family protein [Sinimarinibacterium thermocellulolyticum]|uniref:HupE/UreJ family protein n=1 Tax=Sinimarinibacterium thermocellulolyticum TaxID=3170016 RepID=A0ABV2AE51_9GAMM
MRALLLMLAVLVVGGAGAHPLAPALLSLHQTAPDRFEVLWRSSLVRTPGAALAPQWPTGCAAERREASAIDDDAAWVEHWALHCPAGIEGRRIGVDGLARAGINVILRIQPLHGAAQQVLLDAARSAYVIAPSGAATPVFTHYLALGVEHLLLGPDHLLFVLGLMLLVRGLRAQVWTLTAFTLGHSITLSLAALGLVRASPVLTELAIAASILWLATAILRRGQAPARRPWIMAVLFGLLHGLGFAGALAQTGLPLDEIPQALVAFNLGIEVGQLAVVALVLGAVAVLRRARVRPGVWMAARPLTAYVIGSAAAYWCWERSAVIWL